MKKMILWTIVLFTPLLWTTSVHAIFGIPDVAALAQRVTIIANQGIQIAHSVTQISKITEQMTEIQEPVRTPEKRSPRARRRAPVALDRSGRAARYVCR